MRSMLIVAGLLLLMTPAAAQDDARFELSVGHNVYPHSPRVASIQLSTRVAESNGIRIFVDVGYGLGNETRTHPSTDGLLLGLSGGTKKGRMRYGVQYHQPTGEVCIGIRMKMLSF